MAEVKWRTCKKCGNERTDGQGGQYCLKCRYKRRQPCKTCGGIATAARGYCEPHYKVARAAGLLIPLAKATECSVCQSKEGPFIKGFCNKHYQGVRRDNKPKVAKPDWRLKPSPDRPFYCPKCARYVKKMQNNTFCPECARKERRAKNPEKYANLQTKKRTKIESNYVHILEAEEIKVLEDYKQITVNARDLAKRAGMPLSTLHKALRSLNKDGTIIDLKYDEKTKLVTMLVHKSLDLVLFGGLNARPPQVLDECNFIGE